MIEKHAKNNVRWHVITHKRVFDEVKKLEKIYSLVYHTETVPRFSIVMVWWRKKKENWNSLRHKSIDNRDQNKTNSDHKTATTSIFWYEVGLERKYDMPKL